MDTVPETEIPVQIEASVETEAPVQAPVEVETSVEALPEPVQALPELPEA